MLVALTWRWAEGKGSHFIGHPDKRMVGMSLVRLPDSRRRVSYYGIPAHVMIYTDRF